MRSGDVAEDSDGAKALFVLQLRDTELVSGRIIFSFELYRFLFASDAKLGRTLLLGMCSALIISRVLGDSICVSVHSTLVIHQRSSWSGCTIVGAKDVCLSVLISQRIHKVLIVRPGWRRDVGCTLCNPGMLFLDIDQ